MLVLCAPRPLLLHIPTLSLSCGGLPLGPSCGKGIGLDRTLSPKKKRCNSRPSPRSVGCSSCPRCTDARRY
ncbi:hypothetical protein FIBSPDRAFT_848905 [Athelia psychrophila]|uniref:Secreted protein n=1 Tax=Athelia psychrophila TaxID=1759441 RepID=A0A166UQJ5_9AGAM|nr:hypothetical protein FIBSPDRAFT_848905 [Fibularhizoctonia sp. CBS 109695]